MFRNRRKSEPPDSLDQKLAVDVANVITRVDAVVDRIDVVVDRLMPLVDRLTVAPKREGNSGGKPGKPGLAH